MDRRRGRPLAGLAAGGLLLVSGAARAQGGGAAPAAGEALVSPAASGAEPLDDGTLTRRIVEDVARDASLPPSARGVGIAVVRGRAILSGVVESAGTKARVEAKAARVAGAGNVTDMIAVVLTPP